MGLFNRRKKRATTPHEDYGWPIFEIQLKSGRGIWASSYSVKNTYEGLMAGEPNARVNQWHLESTILVEGPRHGGFPLIFLTDMPPGDNPFPMYEFVSTFRSNSITEEFTGSAVTFVWHQNVLHPPLPDVVREKIQGIDWDNTATEFTH